MAYIVKKGDTLSSIAKANKTTVAALKKANPALTTNPKYNGGNTIFSGTKINLTPVTKKPSTSTVFKTPMTISGQVQTGQTSSNTASTSSNTSSTSSNTSSTSTNPLDTNGDGNPYNDGTPYSAPGSNVPDPSGLSTSSAQTKDTFSLAQLAKQYGIAAAIIANNPSLKAALERILGANGQPMITDPYLQEQIIKETSWWRDQTDKQRQYEFARETNPGQFAADLQANASSIVSKFAAAGLKITAQDAIKYAEQMMQQSVIKDGKVVAYDQKYLQGLMAAAIDFTHTGAVNTDQRVVYTNLSGSMETLAQGLYKQAWDYGFPQTMSNSGFTNWFENSMKGLTAGTLNPEDVDNQLQARAKSFAPGLANLIDQGQTLRQAADPWLNAIANTWEMDVNQVDLNDATVQQVLNQTDEKGNVRPINLYDAKKMARRSDKWDMTQNAKEEKTRVASSILKDFGFLG